MFEQPIKPRGTKKKIKSPFEFSAPNYDQRSGPSVPAGDYYGTGYRNPMGKMRENPNPEISTFPKRSKRAPADTVINALA